MRERLERIHSLSRSNEKAYRRKERVALRRLAKKATKGNADDARD